MRAEPADPAELRCALCGHAVNGDDSGQFRELGQSPVTVVVCADRSACVTRYQQAAERNQ